jgi:spherulation-specific family 4 protein
MRGSVESPSLGVPAYFHPVWDAGAWAALAGVPDASVGLVVINPASGFGAAPDQAYRSLCESPRLRNMLAGYVDSAYSGRPLPDVLAEAVAYRRYYGITAVFIDQVTSGLQGVRYYRRLGEELRKRGTCRLVLNPGVVPRLEYFDLADVVVTFEGTWTAYRSHDLLIATAPARRAATWHLVHTTPVEHHVLSLRMAAARGASYAYVTERTMPNPWDELPASWQRLIDRRSRRGGRAG